MKRNTKIALAVAVILALVLFIPTPYIILKPGTAEDLSRFVDVKEGDHEVDGAFYLVTVGQQRATLFWLIYGFFHPYIDILHQSQVIPPGISQQEYINILERWMEESQLLAKIIALRRAGKPVDIKGKGIAIRAFIEGSPAQEILQVDDVIIRIDGEEVHFADQVLAIIQDREIGDPVNLTLRRDGEEFEADIPTIPHVDNPQKPALGIIITALGDWKLDMPVEIDIKTGNISGPSAGMMFVLEIINQLLPGDLTGGHDIAGTGTISYYEDIGEIGGVKQKVVAAERAGAEYFIIPEGNYSEAKNINKKMKLIPVKNLQDVMAFLAEINMSSSYKTRFSSDDLHRILEKNQVSGFILDTAI
ncbi:MAG: PDZ domain-containing protein [Dethiobacteria bacterium]